MLIDSHCHLDFPDFSGEEEAVLDRAGAAGVGMCLTICTHVTRFPAIAALTERDRRIYGTVGIHPHHVDEEPAIGPAELIAHAAHPRIVGIGETGLDFYYDNSDRKTQEARFRAHIAAARQTGLPVIVHTRDADAETVRILRDEMATGVFPGLIHCFTAGPEVAEAAMEIGFYISVSGVVTFKKADALRAILRTIPPTRLLVETDSPYLAPVPYRGKRNEPAYVAQTAGYLAELLGMTPEALAQQTTENFFGLFRKIDRNDAYLPHAA